MKKMINTLAALLAAANLSAIEIGPTGSGIELSGFADFVLTSESSDEDFSTSQVELNLDYVTGPVAFSLDFDITEADTKLEEAMFTYDMGDGFSLSAGRMLSYLGFEAYDPINMYQYSYAYSFAGVQDVYDAYRDGMSANYVADIFSIGIWGGYDSGKLGYEYVLAYTGVENLTVKAIFAEAAADVSDTYTIWGSYQFDKFMVAAEVVEKDVLAANTATTGDIEGYLVMTDITLTDALGLTLRYSEEEIGTAATYDKFTIAPNYAFTENLSGLVEYSDVDSSDATKKNLFAVEMIYSF